MYMFYCSYITRSNDLSCDVFNHDVRDYRPPKHQAFSLTFDSLQYNLFCVLLFIHTNCFGYSFFPYSLCVDYIIWVWTHYAPYTYYVSEKIYLAQIRIKIMNSLETIPLLVYLIQDIQPIDKYLCLQVSSLFMKNFPASTVICYYNAFLDFFKTFSAILYYNI